MAEYAVHVTTTARLDPDDDRAWDELIEQLAPYAAALGSEGPAGERLSAQLTVAAGDLRDAGEAGCAGVLVALAGLGIAAAVVAVEVTTGDEFARRQDVPRQVDDLASTSEIAELLGVSRQRVLQLAKAPGFPPARRLGARGLHWSRAAVSRFAATWKRSPGPKVRKAG